jgi:opacity protein-like surface antigen
MIIRPLLLLLLVSGAAHPAFAAPVEVHSIQIVPAETTVGIYPEIKGRVKAHKLKSPGETLKIVVVASVVRPDRVVKSWTWKKVSLRSGEIRSFIIPKRYEVKLAGTYKVDFNVYTTDMKPLHRLSKTFVAVDQKPQHEKPATPKEQSLIIQPAPVQATGRPLEYPRFGVGLYADTLHSTGGATMLLWPFRHVGLQVSYTGGSFTITEARVLIRFPFSSGITPYLGAGYLNVTTERSVEIIGLKTKFQDSGVSGVIGIEVPLGKRMFASAEVSGSSIDLKKEVNSGSISGTASVKYAPVTVGISIGYFLF